MATQNSLQRQLFRPAASLLAKHVHKVRAADQLERMMQILEASSARIGGFDVEWYWNLRGVSPGPKVDIQIAAEELVKEIHKIELHPALLLSALATQETLHWDRRASGSYFTDFRLSKYLAQQLKLSSLEGKPFIDPACGSGMLLVATVVELAGHDRRSASEILRHQVFGMDKDPISVRAAGLALSALSSDKVAIKRLIQHLFVCDSLFAFGEGKSASYPEKYAAVVTNPPWEKLKISRHEFLSSRGVMRHYGEDYSDLNKLKGYQSKNVVLKRYAKRLADRFQFSGGELDLYSLFLEMSLDLLVENGQLAAIVPAGFIRSQSTTDLRTHFFYKCSTSKIAIFENRARFFEIDTRFKFLTLYGIRSRSPRRPKVLLSHPRVGDLAVHETKYVSFDVNALRAIRPDLSLPEVRNAGEWSIFDRVSRHNRPLSHWAEEHEMNFCREVDMTRDRRFFERKAGAGRLALIEGRMVHQYTSTAKAYVVGSGRRAEWAESVADSVIAPQFWIDSEKLSQAVMERTRCERIGFCDITGQTNERSMLATIIPANVVCGNKVPTVVFSSANRDAPLVFLGVVNSLIFDWLLRRVLTTTVNYFILKSVPFPAIKPNSPIWHRLVQLVGRVAKQEERLGSWSHAQTRAEIEAVVAKAYGLTLKDVIQILGDFALLDRAEPTIRGESTSTITADLTLQACAKLLKGTRAQMIAWGQRVVEEKAVGAIGFRPSHLFKKFATDAAALSASE